MLIDCIFSIILPTTVVNAEESVEYECVQLPIISDKNLRKK